MNPNGNYEYWGSQTTNGIIPMIRIWKRDHCDEYYGTTIHELAHASHSNMEFWNFQFAETKVKESWARGVQWALTKKVYPTYRGGTNNISKGYTQVVVDLIDEESDAPFNNGHSISNGDDVDHYTIKQIEDTLKGINTWNGWRNNIKNIYNNGTENNKIDILFNSWN